MEHETPKEELRWNKENSKGKDAFKEQHLSLPQDS